MVPRYYNILGSNSVPITYRASEPAGSDPVHDYRRIMDHSDNVYSSRTSDDRIGIPPHRDKTYPRLDFVNVQCNIIPQWWKSIYLYSDITRKTQLLVVSCLKCKIRRYYKSNFYSDFFFFLFWQKHVKLFLHLVDIILEYIIIIWCYWRTFANILTQYYSV